MTSEGHFFFALASTILVKKMVIFSTLENSDWWHVITGSVITCLLPDIDHPQSLLGQRLRWLSLPITRIFGHRGFTHSLLAIITLIILFVFEPLLNAVIPLDVMHGMIIGYLSHIIADMLTPAGVPLFWPCNWRFRLPIIHPSKSNQSERIICIVILIIAIQHPHATRLVNDLTIPDSIQSIWQQVRDTFFLVNLKG